MSRSPYPSASLKSLYRGLNKVELHTLSDGFHKFTVSRLHPWNGSYCRNSGQDLHPKDRGEGEKHSVAWVHCVGQHVIMFFRWTLPTLTLLEKKLETDEKGQERRKEHDKMCIFFLKNKMTVEMIKWSIITIIHLSGVYLWLKNFNNISLPLENGKCILFVSLFFQQWIPIVYSKSTRLRVRRSIFPP